MPEFHIPRSWHHKASGRASVRLGGIDRYMGPWGSKTTRAEYDRLIAKWLLSERILALRLHSRRYRSLLGSGYWEAR
jgi:hypothetical protein